MTTKAQGITLPFRKDAPSLRDYNIDSTGATDVTASIQALLDTCTSLIIPEGLYKITGLEIKSTSPLRELITEGFPKFVLTSALNSVALKVSKPQFLDIGDLELTATGTSTDGLNTVGISLPAESYVNLGKIRATNFSSKGLLSTASVFIGIKEFTCSSCAVGLSLQKSGVGTPNTVISIGRAYISGCNRGFESDGTVALDVGLLVLEYSGNATTPDGALHLTATTGIIKSLYFEANNRNKVLTDSTVVIGAKYELAATAADVISYVGLAFSDRGYTQTIGNTIKTRFLKPDDLGSQDLQIGSNLVAPLAGTSVKFGDVTTETLKGTVPNATWTTVKALVGQSGAGESRQSYRYAVYAGQAGSTTGYDSGYILNGIIYSDSGAVPAWLRINAGNLQLNITSAGVGLNYGCTLVIYNAIGA
jgi:hypothetical protein